MSDLGKIAVGAAALKSREWKMGDHAQCKQTGEYFNSVGVVMAVIQVHRTPSLDVQIGGERVVMATRHWWKVAESETSDSEEDLPASAKALGGPEDGITRDSEGSDDETSDSSSDSSQNSMYEKSPI
jgi:hypothetical protein